MTTSCAPAPPVPTQPPPPPPPISVACTVAHRGGTAHATPLAEGVVKSEAVVPVGVCVGVHDDVRVSVGADEAVDVPDVVRDGLCVWLGVFVEVGVAN